MRHVFNFAWDADDGLRAVTEGGTNRLTAVYDGDGIRKTKTESWPGVSSTHNYSFGEGGIVYDDLSGAIYTPGFGHHVSGVDRFYRHDWLGSTRYLPDATGIASLVRKEGTFATLHELRLERSSAVAE